MSGRFTEPIFTVQFKLASSPFNLFSRLSLRVKTFAFLLCGRKPEFPFFMRSSSSEVNSVFAMGVPNRSLRGRKWKRGFDWHDSSPSAHDFCFEALRPYKLQFSTGQLLGFAFAAARGGTNIYLSVHFEMRSGHMTI